MKENNKKRRKKYKRNRKCSFFKKTHISGIAKNKITPAEYEPAVVYIGRQ